MYICYIILFIVYQNYIKFLCEILTENKNYEVALDHTIIIEIINTLRNLATTRIALLESLKTKFEELENNIWYVDEKFIGGINKTVKSVLKILADHFDQHKKRIYF